MFESLSKRIDELSQKYLKFLEDICNIDSQSYNQKGINEIIKYILSHEEDKGYKVVVKSFEKAGSVLCLDLVNSPNSPFIVLSAHADTVLNAQKVYKDNEFIYGMGVSDCKGGIAMALLVMAVIKEVKTNLNVRFLLQSDEEVSSSISNKETINYILKMAKGCKAFFNLEPKYKGSLTTKRGGIINGKFMVIGKSAHSKDKEKGANAITESAFKIVEILKTAPKNLSLNCGLIKGGTATNAVADKCEFSIEARVETIESFNLAKEFFNQISKKQFVDGTTTQFEVVSDRPPMERKVFNIELLNKINKINEKYGFEILKERSSLGGSDASYTTEQGIPTADGLGMIGYNLHSNEEKAEIKSLTDGAKNLLAIIMEI